MKPSNRALAVLAVVGVGVCVLVWLVGEMAAFLGLGRWGALSPAALPGVLVRLPSRLGNPASAWPVGDRGQLPVGWWWFALAAVLVLAGSAVVALGGVVVVRRVGGTGASGSLVGVGRPSGERNGARVRTGRAREAQWAVPRGPAAGRNVGGARWARARDMRALVVRRPGGRRLVLGRVGGRLVAAERAHSVLVFGPTQSGKTTGLAIPALLEWDGPVVATSVKDDLVGHTQRWRAGLGETWIFDPTGSVTTADPASAWSPLAEAATWSGALRVAQAMVGATPAQTGMADSAFWYQTAAKLLAPLLLAAERGGRPIAQVVRWTNLQETDEPQLLLELAGEHEALQALRAGVGRDERLRSSIYTTLETVLAPYEDPVVARSAELSAIDPQRLLDGANTLYLCGPAHEQARVQGVFSALVGAVVHAAVARYERLGPLDPPLLVVLDEATNIAPVQNLDGLASTGAAMGIQLVTICQDLAQLQSRYGVDRARSIANNHRAKVALSGISDIGTLDTLSGLAGEAAIRQHTMTAEHREGRRSTTTSISYRRLASADELRRIPPGHGLLIYGHLPPARLALRPWYRDRRLRGLVGQDSAAQHRIRLNG